MREIRFRAWDKQINVMSNWDYIKDIWDLKRLESKDRDTIIMQFTGLKDKNSKEIYEGDVVFYDKYILTEKPKKLYIVEWDNQSCGFLTDVPRFKSLSQCEVIGNIYENPELLNDQVVVEDVPSTRELNKKEVDKDYD